MRKYLPLVNLLKFSIIGIGVLLPSSYLKAWDIYVLNAEKTSSGNGVLNRPFTVFESYMTAAGSNLIEGSLSGYNLGDSGAVIINLPANTGYTDQEKAVINQLLHSDVRVLIFGEHSGWANSNQQLADLVGGSYSKDENYPVQSVISNDFPMITGGIDTIYFDAYSKISPANGNGHRLVSDDGMTLWGDNDNFLILMDVDGISVGLETEENGEMLYPQNDLLAKNIANWLSGKGINIPEPSSYALIIGVAGLGFATMRRRRK